MSWPSSRLHRVPWIRPAQATTLSWRRTRSEREIGGGNGWVSFSVMGGGGGSVPSGRYEVILTLPGRPALRAGFTIGGGAMG